MEQDYKKAFAFYAKACDLEHSGACYNLGVSYKKGQGVKQNLKRAKDYYGKACDLGLQQGCDAYKNLN
ncbi:MAG: hypothetical protein MR325_08490 [Helicobacter sp.]|nr:hypothetical protein [Helicobacter sp.]